MYKIAICGKANTGKNTLANLLCEEIYQKDKPEIFFSKFMAFADPIKEIVMTMFPRVSKECLYGPSQLRAEAIPGAFKDGKPLTYRQALIDIGTEVGRKYSDRIWLENFDHRFEMLSSNNNVVIVTDVRFRNEFDHLKEKGFFQIRLYRDTGAPEIQHISETGQSSIKDEEFDYVLHNNKSLDDLKEEVKSQIIPRMI
jgi:GTPase SAR1 family protein